jgi:hypothetical protein
MLVDLCDVFEIGSQELNLLEGVDCGIVEDSLGVVDITGLFQECLDELVFDSDHLKKYLANHWK